MSSFRILIVDDDADHLAFCQEIFQQIQAEVVGASSGEEALACLARERFDIVVSDLVMPGLNGLDLLRAMREKKYDIPVIIMTGYPDLENVEACLESGSFDYIAKPYEPYLLLKMVQRALCKHQKKIPPLPLGEEKEPAPLLPLSPNLIGESPQMQEVFRMVGKVACSNTNVCIYGESGTGKELIARAIHYHSVRKDHPLITCDCTAIPEGLMESEMFGHVKGAFTSAATERDGVFQLANGGTLFLDEIGELNIPLQAKLLRVIQCREFRKVGGTRPIKVNVRLIAATNKDLHAAVKNGTFREDLFYRINVIPITLPPLRERREDIPLLIDFFIQKFNAENDKAIRGVTPRTLQRLIQYEWPGNVRELENTIERAVVMAEGEWIDDRALPWQEEKPNVLPLLPRFQPLAQVEKAYIREVLQAVGGNKRQAARILQISPTTLYHKLRSSQAKAQGLKR
ncbi:MAG: sigma-54-dependent Fis family transcriptional regulator [Nitrospinota bacterium]|nr:MAG: sigma-54-dependent Fis family transcriptional regulator [Nitrospinota bacterium]